MPLGRVHGWPRRIEFGTIPERLADVTIKNRLYNILHNKTDRGPFWEGSVRAFEKRRTSTIQHLDLVDLEAQIGRQRTG